MSSANSAIQNKKLLCSITCQFVQSKDWVQSLKWDLDHEDSNSASSANSANSAIQNKNRARRDSARPRITELTDYTEYTEKTSTSKQQPKKTLFYAKHPNTEVFSASSAHSAHSAIQNKNRARREPDKKTAKR